MLYIAVIGGSNCSEEEKTMALETGREIARRKGVVVCGGGGGVMAAAAEGARREGGDALGILPGSDHRQGNRHLTYAIATGMGEARNAIIARTADAVIAIGGEYGTLSEIALALKMDKPVVGLKSWLLTAPRRLARGIYESDDPKGAVETAFKAAGNRQG